MTAIVVDASAAVPWFLPQPTSTIVDSLLDSERPLLAPEHLLSEVANAILTHTRRGSAPAGHAAAALAMLRRPGQIAWFAVPPLLDAAVTIAEEAAHPLHDCVYLALAKQQNAALATFDKRLSDIARAHGVMLWAEDDAA